MSYLADSYKLIQPLSMFTSGSVTGVQISLCVLGGHSCRETAAHQEWAGKNIVGAESVRSLCRLSSELLGEVFAAVEPAKPRLSLTPDLLELHQV